MVYEKESVRVIEWVSRICCPLRICQPVPASFSRRGASAPQVRAMRRTMKMRSATDGMNRRNQAGGMRTSVALGTRPSAACDGSPINSVAWNWRLSHKWPGIGRAASPCLMRSIRNRLLSIRRNRQRKLNGLAIRLSVRIGLCRDVPSNPTIQVFYYTNLHQLFLVIADLDFERFV